MTVADDVSRRFTRLKYADRNRPKQHRILGADVAKRAKMEAAGSSAFVMAREFGVTVHAIYNWRYRKAKKEAAK